MVMENKALRNKFAEYDGRAREFLASQLQPLCALLSRSAAVLIDSVAREDREGAAVVQSPFSSLEESVQRGGKGRVTLARLTMHQTAMPTLQQNQVHRLLADPYNSNSGEFKGMRHLPAHESATVQLVPLVQRLVHQSLHEALVVRHAATSFATLLPPGSHDHHPSLSVAGLDVASLHDWQQLEQRVRQQSEEQNGAALDDMVSFRQYRHRRLQLHEHWECSNKVVCLVSAISLSSLGMRGFVCAASVVVFPRSQHRVSSSARTLTTQRLPALAQLITSLRSEPAQQLVPQLRNRLGANIDEYAAQIRQFATQLQQQQQRYARKLTQQAR
jgi:hypothetical protein